MARDTLGDAGLSGMGHTCLWVSQAMTSLSVSPALSLIHPEERGNFYAPGGLALEVLPAPP